MADSFYKVIVAIGGVAWLSKVRDVSRLNRDSKEFTVTSTGTTPLPMNTQVFWVWDLRQIIMAFFVGRHTYCSVRFSKANRCLKSLT